MKNLLSIVLDNPELAVDYELLVRKLIAVRERLNMPWDDDMEEILSSRDWLFDTLEERLKKTEGFSYKEAVDLLNQDDF
jgi:hypothetical protein